MLQLWWSVLLAVVVVGVVKDERGYKTNPRSNRSMRTTTRTKRVTKRGAR